MPEHLSVLMTEEHSVNILSKVKKHFAATIIVLLAGVLAMPAQIQNSDNQLNTLSPIGVPPHASLEGTNEQVDLATGNLTLYLPMLSLPQRGGWPLPLGCTYDSRQYSPVQYTTPSTTIYNTDGRLTSVTSYQYSELFIARTDGLWTRTPAIIGSYTW